MWPAPMVGQWHLLGGVGKEQGRDGVGQSKLGGGQDGQGCRRVAERRPKVYGSPTARVAACRAGIGGGCTGGAGGIRVDEKVLEQVGERGAEETAAHRVRKDVQLADARTPARADGPMAQASMSLTSGRGQGQARTRARAWARVRATARVRAKGNGTGATRQIWRGQRGSQCECWRVWLQSGKRVRSAHRAMQR